MLTRTMAAAALALVCSAAPAAVLVLYDESVSGDMAGPLGGTGPGGPLLLQAGQNQIIGRADAHRNALGGTETNDDYFHFTLGSGLQIVGMRISYRFSATRGNVTASAGVGYYDQPGIVPPPVVDVVAMGASGTETLFDASVWALASSGQNHVLLMSWNQLNNWVNDTSASYNYTVTFDVANAAVATVASPPSLALVALGLGAVLATRRRQRWAQRSIQTPLRAVNTR